MCKTDGAEGAGPREQGEMCSTMFDPPRGAIDGTWCSGSCTTDLATVVEASEGASKNAEAAMLPGTALMFGAMNGAERSRDGRNDGAEND